MKTLFAIGIVMVCCLTAYGQRVTKVIDSVTIGLEDGRAIRLKGIEPAADAETQRRGQVLLELWLLDRPVVLTELTESEWGVQEAIVTWRGIVVAERLAKKQVVVASGTAQTAPVQVQAPPPALPQQQVIREYVQPRAQPRVIRTYRYVPYQGTSTQSFSSGAACVGNT